MKSRSLFCAALAVLLLQLSACGHPAPEASGAAAEGLSATDTITPEEGVAILEKQLGAVDEATGNVMSYGYEGPLTLDGVDYYNYRVSWLVDGDHLSYLTNYLVSTDGLMVRSTCRRRIDCQMKPPPGLHSQTNPADTSFCQAESS